MKGTCNKLNQFVHLKFKSAYLYASCRRYVKLMVNVGAIHLYYCELDFEPLICYHLLASIFS